MKWKTLFAILYLYLICISGCASTGYKEGSKQLNSKEMQSKPYVVLVSIDGYRSDYTRLYSPPTLTKLQKEGASTKALLPVYPSKTFTNHYSIITGLYADHHGIVANYFYDPLRKQEYKISNPKATHDGTWYGGTPLWVAAEKQGMLSATFFWPGSEADIQGILPRYYFEYNPQTSLEKRVDQVNQWLSLPPEKRPHLVAVYFSDVDDAGHKFGPNSEEVKNAVLKVDQAVERLIKGIEATRLPVNVIVVSDHGMQEVDYSKIEFLDNYTDLSSARVYTDGPQALIYSDDPRQVDQIYKDLKKKEGPFKVYKRQDLPSRFHYSLLPRSGDVIVVPEVPYAVALSSMMSQFNSKGVHGYDPDHTPTMHGIFYAQGPHIYPKKKLEPFRNIHLYPFIIDILGLKYLSPIDGDPGVLKSLIKPSIQ
jgi:alkaline phosphatase D